MNRHGKEPSSGSGSKSKSVALVLKRHRLAYLSGAVALVLCLALPFFAEGALAVLRYQVFDFYQRSAPRAAADAPTVAIVDIDNESLRRLGQWPWPRSTIARLIEAANARGPSAIALDMVFAEPDRTSPSQLLRGWAKTEVFEDLKALTRKLPDHDAVLAQTFLKAPVVSGFILTNEESADAVAPKSKAGFAFGGSHPRSSLPVYRAAIANLRPLQDSAPGSGFFSLPTDTDGIVRRLPLLAVTADGHLLPSLVAETLRVAQGASTILVRMSDASGETDVGQDHGLVSIRIGGATIPTTEKGELWLHYGSTARVPVIPAWKMLAQGGKGGDAALIQPGMLVIIGTSAPGLRDLKSTPLKMITPGALIQAEALEQIIAGDFLSRPGWALGAEWLAAAAIGLVLLVIVPLSGALIGLALTAGAGAGLLFIGLDRFASANIILDPVLPAGTAAVVFIAAVSASLFRSERERTQIKSLFGRYLSPRLVEVLSRSPQDVRLGGENRDLTVMFLDIRGFTALSEDMEPTELTSFINQFHTPMTHVLLRYDATIDKYMGDAIMSFWNAPLDVPDHPERACRAVLELRKELEKLNDTWAAEPATDGRGPIRIGIGLNTGTACVGNLGSQLRFDYSALGDTVNLASRLEGLTKSLNTDIILGQETARRVPDFAMLGLGTVTVRNRVEPVHIYALVGDESVAGLETFRSLSENFVEARHAIEAREWARAGELLDRCLKIEAKEGAFDVSRLLLGQMSLVEAGARG